MYPSISCWHNQHHFYILLFYIFRAVSAKDSTAQGGEESTRSDMKVSTQLFNSIEDWFTSRNLRMTNTAIANETGMDRRRVSHIRQSPVMTEKELSELLNAFDLQVTITKRI